MERGYCGQANSQEFRRDSGFYGRHFGSGIGGFGGLGEAGEVMLVTVSLEVGSMGITYLHLPYSCGGHHGGSETLEPAVLGSGSRGAQTGVFS